MHTNGAAETTGRPPEGPTPRIARPGGASEAIHDLLVMSHAPDAGHACGSNHACLNSFTSSSWTMVAGARPKIMVGR
jgi:hypothetical protein